MAQTNFDLKGYLPLIASGKVRELYEIDANSLLFVATDRISAYDVIMSNGVPQKGAILTSISKFWFSYLTSQIPSLRTHLLSTPIPSGIPGDVAAQIAPRSMVVRKLKVFPIEAIVRGYITGSAWSSYQKTGEVNGKNLPQGLQESDQFPEPLYTPSTKAELYAKRIEDLAIQIYQVARDYAKTKGIIIADTKFEFGLDEETDEVVLIDEVLTPDSSRFWPAASYVVGKGQDSFDKQFLRDWLTKEGLKGKDGVSMPEDVVQRTSEKYQEAFKMLTGKSLEEALRTS
ncbi:Phosphoribosylaminoimidazole-succinocarboxamide synthase [Cyphellophora attinorum]|uniref:Phosphoribosylaminoimidazole-succinocarboxamide synthase n=1 Tax=Cyphellophora attinorum TaxID=1664694 RepID=A0A0N1HV75_9EURO|nr:Phosphoribosylaminoimidazole-succinocarboxamide synthase [Phialophora attinorum]KPI43572.1 Phosphoribosylaminoimidazole-succinocarboxamide synthase [Phialophora attinorum]